MAYIAFVVLLGGALLMAVRMRSFWAGTWIPEQEYSLPPAAWLLGKDIWIAAQRALPFLCPIFAGAAIGLVGLEAEIMWLFRTAMAVVAPLCVCHASVVFYNDPKWVVPPRFRKEPGVAEIWGSGIEFRRS